MKGIRKISGVVAAIGFVVAGSASAAALLTKEQYIDYSAQMKCAEQLYSFSDPDKYEKEQNKIEKTFGIKDKDIESGTMDELSATYDADSAVYDAIDVKKAALCPQPE